MGARPVPPSPGEWPGLSGTGRVGTVSFPEGQWLGLPGVRGQRQGRARRGAEPRGTPLPHFLKGSSSCWNRWPCSGGWAPRTRSGACGQAPRVGPPGGHGPLGAARAPAVSPRPLPPFSSFPLLPPSFAALFPPPAVRPLLLCPTSPQPRFQHLRGQKRTRGAPTGGGTGPRVQGWPPHGPTVRGDPAAGTRAVSRAAGQLCPPRPACLRTPPLFSGGQLDTGRGFRVGRRTQAGWREPPSALFAR